MTTTDNSRSGPPPEFPPDDQWGDGPAAYEPGNAPRAANDRTPPQDNAAEQSVLGSMLISKDAIAEVSEVMRGGDYYRPAHAIIHDEIGRASCRERVCPTV